MFSRIYLNNFRCFRDANISFLNNKGGVKPVILLFGDHDSGKSSFIKALSFLRETSDLLLYNRLYQLRTKPRYQHDYIPTTLAELVHNNMNVDTCESEVVQLIYEMEVDKSRFVYELVFSIDGAIVSESLVKKNGSIYTVLFSVSSLGFELAKGLISRKNSSQIQGLYDQYFGEYTFLSILNYGTKEKLFQVKKTLQNVMTFINMCYIMHDTYHHQKRFNFSQDMYIVPQEGYTNYKGMAFLKAGELILNEFLKAHFLNLHHIKYKFTKLGSNRYSYEFVTYLKTRNRYIKATDSMLSSSYRNVVEYATALMDLKFGYTVILDDITRNFEGPLVYRMFLETQRNKGQLILSFTSGDIMNTVDPRSIYICITNEDGTEVSCIEDIVPTRANQNIRRRYLTGMYNQGSEFHQPNFYKYDEWIHDQPQVFEEIREQGEKD